MALQEPMGDYQPGTVERLQDTILKLANEKQEAIEALRELQEILGNIAYPDPMTTRRELVTMARDALGPSDG